MLKHAGGRSKDSGRHKSRGGQKSPIREREKEFIMVLLIQHHFHAVYTMPFCCWVGCSLIPGTQTLKKLNSTHLFEAHHFQGRKGGVLF